MVLPTFPLEADALQRLTVRLVADFEQAEFDRQLEAKHYLRASRVVGESLRYVMELDGQWVALAVFSAASLHLKAREQWIGWSPRQRARRLSLVVNNSRFLVLAERHRYPNLASRALGSCLRRLSQDWLARWGHPVWVVETFVDETRFRGTCYRACGFEAVGPTAGFARASRDYYDYHGEPKQLYLRELEPGARKRLRQARWSEALSEYEANLAGPCPFQGPALQRLVDRGNTIAGGGRSWAGDMAEILIYNASLSATQIQQVEAYLYSKWFGSVGAVGYSGAVTVQTNAAFGGYGTAGTVSVSSGGIIEGGYGGARVHGVVSI